MTKPMPICLHFHIFKNAGTTMEWILRKNFSKDAISIDTDDPGGILPNYKIIDVIKKNPDIKAISSHQIRFPTPTQYQFTPIVMVRHPIDRAISIYHFQKRRKDANRPGILKAKELDLNGYIKWNLETKSHMAMRNFQVLFLSSKPVSAIVNSQDLSVSLKRIRNCSIIGVVDRFDESLVIAEEALRKYFPHIDLSYVKQNVSNREESLKRRLAEGMKMIKSEIFEGLQESNRFDIKLYSVTNQELDKRIDNIPDFHSKLVKFKEKCNKLSHVSYR